MLARASKKRCMDLSGLSCCIVHVMPGGRVAMLKKGCGLLQAFFPSNSWMKNTL